MEWARRLEAKARCAIIIRNEVPEIRSRTAAEANDPEANGRSHVCARLWLRAQRSRAPKLYKSRAQPVSNSVWRMPAAQSRTFFSVRYKSCAVCGSYIKTAYCCFTRGSARQVQQIVTSNRRRALQTLFHARFTSRSYYLVVNFNKFTASRFQCRRLEAKILKHFDPCFNFDGEAL